MGCSDKGSRAPAASCAPILLFRWSCACWRRAASPGRMSPRPSWGPRLTDLHDPSLIPDLDRAAERLLAAVMAREAVVIYGDYDVDGITATAILYHLLRHVRPDADVRTYVPPSDGRGVWAERGGDPNARRAGRPGDRFGGLRRHEHRARAGGEAAGRGPDHHRPTTTRRRRSGSSPTPSPWCTRAAPIRRTRSRISRGRGWRTSWRGASRRCTAGTTGSNPTTRRLLVELLTYAALGTIADVVPLLGENRVIARQRAGADPATSGRTRRRSGSSAGCGRWWRRPGWAGSGWMRSTWGSSWRRD